MEDENQAESTEESQKTWELQTLRQEVCSQRGFVRQMRNDGYGLNYGLKRCLECPANEEYAKRIGCENHSFNREEENLATKPKSVVEMKCLACKGEEVFRYVKKTGNGLMYTCLRCGKNQIYNEADELKKEKK